MSDESDRQSRHDGDDGTPGIDPDADGSDSSTDAGDRSWQSDEESVPAPDLDPEPVPDPDPDTDSGSVADADGRDGGTDGAVPDPVSARAEGIGASGAAGTGGATGAGVSTETETPGAPGVGDPFVDEEPEKPPDDEEMPLADHIEEMIKRLAVVVIAVALATAVSFPFAAPVINVMWYDLLPASVPPPHLYGPLEKLLTEIKVASLAGILVALPVLVYEAYLFMRPGLYPKERRYFLSAVPTSLVLGAIGMAFAYFLILPVLFQYFVVYSESGVDKLAFGLQVTFDLIVALLSAFAFVFQIPLLVMLAIMMGVTTRQWLESRRIYFWAGFLGVGFLLGGADLTGMAPIVIAATMIGLFEGTLALLRWTKSG